MTNKLKSQKCVPCKLGDEPLKQNAMKEYLDQIDSNWEVIDNHHLHKKYTFKNFREALAFTNIIGEIAEENGHHPDILLKWGEVTVEIFTHKVNGLLPSDFIMADKIEACYIAKCG